MENILTFLENNYIWFLVAAFVLLLALIGFIVDSKRKQKKKEGEFSSLENSVPENSTLETPMAEPMTNETMASTTPVVEAPVFSEPTTPIESFVGTPVSNETNVNTFSAPAETSETLTFNDVPAPTSSFEMPTVETPKEEIVETFDFGNPVEAPAPAPVVETPIVETPITSVEAPSVNMEPTMTFEPVKEEPAVNVTEPVQPQNTVQTNEEPIIKIE